jgi:hypothetical protein
MRALDNGSSVILLLLDLSAAFDTIDHKILLHRLEHVFGIKGTALCWIRSYLHERYQFVNVNGSLSEPARLDYGVPQGSVLGPKLFSMYMQPLGHLIQQHHLSMHFYADDTQIYVSFQPEHPQSQNQAHTNIVNGVKAIRQWMSDNMLKLNDDKMEFLMISSKFKSKLRVLHDFNITIGDSSIQPQQCVRNLGVYFDKHMTLEQHVNRVCRTAYMHMMNIGKIRNYITMDAAKSLMQGLVISRLDYCNSLLFNLPAKIINKLQRVQNASARIIVKAHRYDEMTPVRQALHWLPVNRRCQYKLLLYVYMVVNGFAPQYLSDMLTVYKPARTLRSQSGKIYIRPPKIKQVTYGERYFGWCAAELWNSIPQQLQRSVSTASFKKALKTYLYRLEYGVV